MELSIRNALSFLGSTALQQKQGRVASGLRLASCGIYGTKTHRTKSGRKEAKRQGGKEKTFNHR
jgi:hypothetical protein